MGESNEGSSISKMGVFAGALVTVSLFFLGLLIKEQTDVATITQRESDHHTQDEHEFASLQLQVDHRFDKQDEINRERMELVEKNKASVDDIKTAIAADKMVVTQVLAEIETLKRQYDVGRGERVATDDSLLKRIEELSARLIEIQRQGSLLEGRLDSLGAKRRSP